MELVIQNLISQMETKEDMAAAIFKRFGDEQSSLLDKYERLSFEVQLNQAILGRSLSEPARRQRPPPKPVAKERNRFQKAMKKLLSPILGKKGAIKDAARAPKDGMLWKTFSRSLRG